MTEPTPHAPGESRRDLLSGWNLGDEPEGIAGPDESLRGLSRGLDPDNLDGVGDAPPWSRKAQGDGIDADLFRAFTLAGETDSTEDAELGLGDHASIARFSQSIPPTVPKPDHGSRAPLVFPKPGQTVGGFMLVAELGRGAFARVYLAEQASLGHRLVALKVSRAEGEEPQILARLQHTHIVPIYSLHDEPETNLRLMCMPFLGGANLAQVLEAAGARLPTQATGRSLVDALDVVSNRFQAETKVKPEPPGSLVAKDSQDASSLDARPEPDGPPSSCSSVSTDRERSLWAYLPGWRRPKDDDAPLFEEPEFDQPARQFLREANYVQAAVWIVARLAEGLEHAHSRGLLHRDLKPSNVLIAADGTPMLLDFNLSTDTRPGDPEAGTRALLGGTLPYMAPEHLDAFDPNGTTPADAVDERSDLYSLGLILYEMIAGQHPFPDPPPHTPLPETVRYMIERRRQVPSLRAACPEVPWSLAALVAKCLDPDPDRRYARARELAEDLRRFLEDLPLKHAGEPSVPERLAKWARRNPRLCSSTSIAVVSTALLLALGAIMALLSESLKNVSARLKLQAFQSRFNDCQFLLNTVSGPVNHLGAGVTLADETLERLGFGKRGEWQRGSWVGRLTPAEQSMLHERVTELILLEARARAYQAGRVGSEADQRLALEWAVRWLSSAERLDPKPPAALYGERARYLAALGLSDEAACDRAREAETPPATGRDFALRGTALLAQGDPSRAEESLRRAIALDNRSFWAWFALGLCHYDQGRFLESAGDFAACTVLEPRFAWPQMNRGLALAQAGRLAEARDCYDHALENNPRFAEALVNRALVHLELNDPGRAELDLRQAVALGRSDSGVLAALGEALYRLGRLEEGERLYTRLLADRPDDTMVLVARGIFRLSRDPSGARADLTRALALQPRNSRAHYGMGRLLARDEPRAALAHVESALDVSPSLFEALELRALLRARMGDAAAIDDAELLVKSPTPTRLYNAACALALLAERRPDQKLDTRALALLAQALESGLPVGVAAADPDWQAFRQRADFQQLIHKAASPRRAAP
jgi:serine/threonine protein kinase/Tfp pilus assembly protein PilF